MTFLLKIADWDELYENSRTREMKRMKWVPVPCKFDGDGYTELVTRHKNGPAHYAAWMGLLLCAGRSELRGTLIRSNGKPHDTATISAMTKIPASLLDEALPRLIEIGWIVSETDNPDRQDVQEPGDSPAQPQVACGEDVATPQVNSSLPARSRARAGASILSILSIPFFQGKGVRGKGTELPEILDTDEFRQSLDIWLAYKLERREGYKPVGLQQMLTHAANMAKKHGLHAIIEAMTRVMANGWKGWDQDSIFNSAGVSRSGSAIAREKPQIDFGQFDERCERDGLK
jgi:hypothetical protein